MAGGAVKGGEPYPSQQVVKLRNAVLSQRDHGRHVQRARQRFVGMHRSVVPEAVVLRGEPVDVNRDIRQQFGG